MWDRLKTERDAWIADQTPESIKITLPDGKEVPGETWRTTPYDVAVSISKGLADNCVVAKVDGDVWDLDRPFERSCKLQLVKVFNETPYIEFALNTKISYNIHQ